MMHGDESNGMELIVVKGPENGHEQGRAGPGRAVFQLPLACCGLAMLMIAMLCRQLRVQCR